MHRDRPQISCLDSFTTEHQRSPVDVRHASKITPSTIGPSAKDSEGIKEMGFFPFSSLVWLEGIKQRPLELQGFSSFLCYNPPPEERSVISAFTVAVRDFFHVCQTVG